MNIVIITDQHFGARKGAEYINNYFQKFYDDIFQDEIISMTINYYFIEAQ